MLYDSEDFFVNAKIFNSVGLEEYSVIRKILITANNEKSSTLFFTV